MALIKYLSEHADAVINQTLHLSALNIGVRDPISPAIAILFKNVVE
jgi:hypothetical protein